MPYSIPEVYASYVQARERNEPCINLYRALCVEIEGQYNALPSDILVEFEPYSYVNANAMFWAIDGPRVLIVDNRSDVITKGHPLAIVNAEHGVSYNLLFRAVHDFYGHYLTGSGFDWEGECTAFDHHSKMFSRKLRGILKGEVLGQAAYKLTTGKYISPQPMVNMEI